MQTCADCCALALIYENGKPLCLVCLNARDAARTTDDSERHRLAAKIPNVEGIEAAGMKKRAQSVRPGRRPGHTCARC
jgi:hypothetical protein